MLVLRTAATPKRLKGNESQTGTLNEGDTAQGK